MKINFEKLNLPEEKLTLINEIVKNNGEIYLTKPKKASGEAKYIWRNVMFYISPNRVHHCIPVMSEFDLPLEYFGSAENHSRRREKIEELDQIVDEVVNTFPKSEWLGVKRWSMVF